MHERRLNEMRQSSNKDTFIQQDEVLGLGPFPGPSFRGHYEYVIATRATMIDTGPAFNHEL